MKNRKRSGQAMVEYIIIVVVIAIAALAVFGYFGGAVQEKVAARKHLTLKFAYRLKGASRISAAIVFYLADISGDHGSGGNHRDRKRQMQSCLA